MIGVMGGLGERTVRKRRNANAADWRNDGNDWRLAMAAAAIDQRRGWPGDQRLPEAWLLWRAFVWALRFVIYVSCCLSGASRRARAYVRRQRLRRTPSYRIE